MHEFILVQCFIGIIGIKGVLKQWFKTCGLVMYDDMIKVELKVMHCKFTIATRKLRQLPYQVTTLHTKASLETV